MGCGGGFNQPLFARQLHRTPDVDTFLCEHHSLIAYCSAKGEVQRGSCSAEKPAMIGGMAHPRDS